MLKLAFSKCARAVSTLALCLSPAAAMAQPQHADLPPELATSFALGDYASGLEVAEERLSECPPEVRLSPDCMGRLLVAANLSIRTGRLVQAEDYLRRVMRNAGSIASGDWYALAVQDNFAFIYEASGREPEAAQLLKYNLEIRRRRLGECHRTTGANYDNLGMILHRQDRQKDATPYLLLGLAARRCAHGENHPETASSYNNVAFNLAWSGYPAATVENYLRRAVASGAASGQRDAHPQQLARIIALGFVLQAATGHPSEGYALYVRTLPSVARRVERGVSPYDRGSRELAQLRPHFLGQIRAAWLAAEVPAAWAASTEARGHRR